MENASPASYTLSLDLHVHIPHASTTQEDLASLNPALPALLPALPAWLKTARVSPFYERLYRRKIESLQQNLLRLDQLLSRHDFFDCETILELTPTPIPPAKDPRKLLLIQSDMDVDSDGSDPDRVPVIDSASTTYQPLTSYKWPKRGTTPNPFIPPRQARLRLLQAALDTTSDPTRRDQLKASADATRFEIKDLTAYSFLVGTTDPFIVIPGSLFAQHDDPYSPGVGDFCAVIYNNVLYPAIIGDVGPVNKIGEASLRIAQEINPHATAENRPVSPLKVTYLLFPGTAERPFSPPDLQHIHDRVDALLKESGGYTGQLFLWKDLTVPPPTPTPSPTPIVSPSPSSSPSASPSPSASTSP